MHSLIKVRSWRTENLVLIFIKNPDNILENYRPVRFTSALGNLTNRIIKNAAIKKKKKKNPEKQHLMIWQAKFNTIFLKEYCTSLIL